MFPLILGINGMICLLVLSVDARTPPDCLMDLPNACNGIPDGDYPVCSPLCKDGVYITCQEYIPILKKCGLDWYDRSPGVFFLDSYVFDPSVHMCNTWSGSCPRNMKEQALKRTSETEVEADKDCLKNSKDACKGMADGSYSVCKSLCREGIFFTCVDGSVIIAECPEGWYTSPGGNRFRANTVFFKPRGECVYGTSACPRPFDELTEPDCLERSTETCAKMENGDYLACSPYCEEGTYWSCVDEAVVDRQCPIGFYVKPDGTRYTSPLVYDPESNACQYQSKSCPRQQDYFVEQ